MEVSINLSLRQLADSQLVNKFMAICQQNTS